MAEGSDDIYKEYKNESKEILKNVRNSCESLRKGSDKDALTELMKCNHKLKGVAAMMEYWHIAEVAEEMEYVSKLLVEGKLQLSQEIVGVLWDSANLLAKYIETDFDERDTTLLAKLRKLSNK